MLFFYNPAARVKSDDKRDKESQSPNSKQKNRGVVLDGKESRARQNNFYLPQGGTGAEFRPSSEKSVLEGNTIVVGSPESSTSKKKESKTQEKISPGEPINDSANNPRNTGAQIEGRNQTLRNNIIVGGSIIDHGTETHIQGNLVVPHK
jgi:hypothetical protein